MDDATWIGEPRPLAEPVTIRLEFDGDHGSFHELLRDAIADRLDAAFEGIITALPAAPEPPPILTVEALNRTMRQIYQDTGYGEQGYQEFRCGHDVPEQLATGLPMRPAEPGGLDSIFGIRMVVDETLAPDEWRVVDDRGRILRQGSGGRQSGGTLFRLPPSQRPGFSRFERIATEDASGGDLLDRIDSAIEAWEHGSDAYHYVPEEPADE